MPDLIVTADDYGLCDETNQAILRLYDEGIVNCAQLLTNTEHFDASARDLSSRPGLTVGIHLNLTDGKPVLPAGDIRTLTGKNDEFYGGRHYKIMFMVMSGIMSRKDIYKEWRAQIIKIKDAGISIASMTSHGHLHLLPRLHQVVIDLLREFKIPYLRLVFSGKSYRARILTVFSKLMLSKVKNAGLDTRYARQILGIDCQGHLDQTAILRELNEISDNTVEVIVHPASRNNMYHNAWGYEGAREYEALMSDAVRKKLLRLRKGSV